MKISDFLLQEVQRSTQCESEKGRGVESGEFARLLDDQMGAGASASGVTQADPLAALSAASYPPRVSEDLEVVSQRVSQEIETTATSLERLQGLLEGGSMEAGTVENAISGLASEVNRLQSDLSGLPEGHELRQLGEEVSILAYTESFKWHRGDYA